MTHYIALIHEEADSGYGVSFPDVPGVIAVVGGCSSCCGDTNRTTTQSRLTYLRCSTPPHFKGTIRNRQVQIVSNTTDGQRRCLA